MTCTCCRCYFHPSVFHRKCRKVTELICQSRQLSGDFFFFIQVISSQIFQLNNMNNTLFSLCAKSPRMPRLVAFCGEQWPPSAPVQEQSCSALMEEISPSNRCLGPSVPDPGPTVNERLSPSRCRSSSQVSPEGAFCGRMNRRNNGNRKTFMMGTRFSFSSSTSATFLEYLTELRIIQ